MSRLVTALIPYFDGISTATHSLTSTRLEYLTRTVESLDSLGWDVHVGTVEDFSSLSAGECKPEFLPAALLNWAQENLESKYFYVTEADQVLHFDPSVLDFVQGDRYLVPHRLERVPEPVIDGVFVNQSPYSFANGLPVKGRVVYPAENRALGFAGAFLCTGKLFRKVDFTFAEQYPVEHSTGFDVFEAGKCFKTGVFGKFWVDHLSGAEFQSENWGNRLERVVPY